MVEKTWKFFLQGWFFLGMVIMSMVPKSCNVSPCWNWAPHITNEDLDARIFSDVSSGRRKTSPVKKIQMATKKKDGMIFNTSQKLFEIQEGLSFLYHYKISETFQKAQFCWFFFCWVCWGKQWRCCWQSFSSFEQLGCGEVNDAVGEWRGGEDFTCACLVG